MKSDNVKSEREERHQPLPLRINIALLNKNYRPLLQSYLGEPYLMRREQMIQLYQ